MNTWTEMGLGTREAHKMVSTQPGPRSARAFAQYGRGPRMSKDPKRPAYADCEDPDWTVQTHGPVQVLLTHTLHMRVQAHPHRQQ